MHSNRNDCFGVELSALMLLISIASGMLDPPVDDPCPSVNMLAKLIRTIKKLKFFIIYRDLDFNPPNHNKKKGSTKTKLTQNLCK